jgi:hypothetical protein
MGQGREGVSQGGGCLLGGASAAWQGRQCPHRRRPGAASGHPPLPFLLPTLALPLTAARGGVSVMEEGFGGVWRGSDSGLVK